MIIDFANRFSTLQAATDATGASTNVIDMTKAGDAVAGAELYLVVRVGTAISSAANGATLKIALQTSSTEAFSAVKELVSVSIVEAGLTANTIVFKVKVPPGVLEYLRLYYTESGEAITAGTIDAFLTPDVNIA